MDKTPAYYVFLGLLTGAIIGYGIGALNDNTMYGMQLGALAGVFIGWIRAAPIFKR